MKKQFKINKDQSMELNSSLGWLYVYKEQFGHDILPDVMPLIESGLSTAVKVMRSEGDSVLDKISDEILTDIFIELTGLELSTMLNIIWSMAKNASDSIKAPEAFYNQFDMFPLDQVMPQVVKMIINSSVSTKNARSLLAIAKEARQSISTKSASQDSTEG